MEISNTQTPGKIIISSNDVGFETFTFTLKKGAINAQQLQVLLEFKMLCRPYHALKSINNLMFSDCSAEQSIIEKEALKELLNLFTGLWEAEHNDHEPIDLNMFP